MSKIAVVTAVSAGALFVLPSAIDAAELMRYGQQSDDVKELQIVLKEQGYFNDHRATGYFGQLTLSAVRSFQADHQLAVDGIVGPKTLAKLHGDSQNEEPSFPNLNQPIELLQNGSSGEKIIALQVELKQLGYFNSRIDGFFGRITRDAVVRFQRSHGLSADGIVGPKTKQQIAIAIGTEAVPEEVAPPYEPEETLTASNLSYGHAGERVSELQQLLKDHGYYQGAITGVFGQATERAVRALQAENGLAVDGIAGPDTMNWLQGNEAVDPDSDFAYGIGDTGPVVQNIQLYLRDLGYLEDYATGEFDEATQYALQAFQRANNLEVTGVANKATIDRLEEVHVLPGEAEEPPPERPDVEERQELIYLASTLVGTPFVFGGTTPDGFDASGFVYYVYSQKGHSIPRTIRNQYEASSPVERPSVGDLVFFDTSGGPTYVGMYVGNQTFVHASQSQGVIVSSLEQSYWNERFIEARTIISQ